MDMVEEGGGEEKKAKMWEDVCVWCEFPYDSLVWYRYGYSIILKGLV
jgi:hypothetical protein